jgi:hypothetical protein
VGIVRGCVEIEVEPLMSIGKVSVKGGTDKRFFESEVIGCFEILRLVVKVVLVKGTPRMTRSSLVFHHKLLCGFLIVADNLVVGRDVLV